MCLALTGCRGIKAPDSVASNKIGETVTGVQSNLQDQASGTNAAIGHTAQKLPESREKEVILMFVGDQFRLLGHPKIETQTEFVKAAENLLSQEAAKRAMGEDQRAKLAANAESLQQKLITLKKNYEIALAKESADHAAEIEAARLEGEEKQKRLIAWIFFGGGGLLIAGGVAMLVFAAQIPMFGPKAAFGTMIAGGASILTGVLTLQLMKQLDQHPWILWAGGGVITIALTAVGALLYANQKHANDGLQP